MHYSRQPNTILFVDQCYAVCTVVARILKAHHYKVLTATDADGALKAAQAIPQVDILLTYDGIAHEAAADLSRRFLELHPDADVLVLTAGYAWISRSRLESLLDSVSAVLTTRDLAPTSDSFCLAEAI